VQQIGNAIGVAVIGLIYFAALHGGQARAFDLSVAALAALLAALIGLSAFLPRTARGL